ncbi:MAG: hypothetical protein AAF806_10420 [Bacteroidota bacterium]
MTFPAQDSIHSKLKISILNHISSLVSRKFENDLSTKDLDTIDLIEYEIKAFHKTTQIDYLEFCDFVRFSYEHLDQIK